MRRDVCFYPDRAESLTGELPEGFDEWRDPSGLCSHEYCLEGNRIGRLYRSSAKVQTMTRDEIESLKADHELIADEYHGWFKDEGGYVLVAEEGN